MKSRSFRLALLSAIALTSPLLPFAGSQPAKVRNYTNRETLDASPTRALQQGKGSGMSQNQTVRANAWRSQTAEDSLKLREKPATTHINWGDSAFRK
jgi:hypothetical protein